MSYTPQLWNMSSAAAELAVDRRAVGRACATIEPVKTDGKSKYWLMADIVRALYADSGAINPAHEKGRLDKLRADKVELELDIARGKVVPLEAAADTVDRLLAAVRARILGLPTKAAPAVLGLESLPEIRDAIDIHVRECLNELAEISPTEIVATRAAVTIEGTAETSDQPVGGHTQEAEPRK